MWERTKGIKRKKTTDKTASPDSQEPGLEIATILVAYAPEM